MPVSATWDTQEAVPEQFKAHVVEKDGKFTFEAETAAEVANLKTTLRKERDARTKHESELKRFEKLKPVAEADEEEVEQFLESWQKRGEKGNGKPDPDAAKQAEMEQKLREKQFKKLADENTHLKGEHEKTQKELMQFRLWTPIREVALKSGVIPEDWELARLELSNQNRFGFDDDGKIVVLDSDGTPSTVTPEKFFKEVYSDQRPKFYKPTGAGGGGATGGVKGNVNAKTMKRIDFNGLSPQAQHDYLVRDKGAVVD